MSTEHQERPALVHTERVTAGLDLLATVTRRESQQPDELIANVLMLIGECLDVGLAGFARLEGASLSVERVYDRAGMGLAAGVSRASEAFYQLMLHDHALRAIVVEDLRDSSIPAAPGTNWDPAFGAYSGVPLVRANRTPHGVLFTVHPDRRTVQEGELALLSLAGRIIVDSLEAAAMRQELCRLDERVRSAYMAMACGVVIMDETGRVVNANDAAQIILGITAAEMVGQVLEDCYATATRADGSLLEVDERPSAVARRNGQAVHAAVLRITRFDRSARWLQADAVPVFDREGQLAQVVLSFLDVTERMHAQAQISAALVAQRAANEELKVLNTAKSDFISVVSHEFRTPLTGIQGFSEILRDVPLSTAEVQEYAADINADAKRLSRLVDQILDLDGLLSGRISLTRTWCNLNHLLRDVVDTTAQTHPHYRIKMQLRDGPLPVHADRDRLAQVVSNLLANAIKFSKPETDIVITNSMVDGVAQVSIADQGIGIPPEQVARVFDRYWRSHSGPTKYAQGSGLGLPLVRQIVDMHGGRVWVTSELDRGSTFSFSIPVPVEDEKMFQGIER